MKKIVFALLPFLFLGCADKEDDPNSLPYVDVSKFQTGTSIDFPEKTTALEIYSMMYGKYGLGSHTVSGVYSHTESAKLNGKVFSDTVTKNITKVEIYRTDGEISHSFHSDFSCDDGSKIEFYYQWQEHNTNVWHNNESDGTIRIN